MVVSIVYSVHGLARAIGFTAVPLLSLRIVLVKLVFCWF